MPRIKILPVDLRNKIAAGEVIERPASVVKELIENSIDAGATEIKVEVEHGGKQRIRVFDNGEGMDREDALLCFEPHATSKIAKDEDLFAIRTLGFRGEALPSIASISRVALITGQKGSASGIEITIDGGERTEVRESPCLGTSLEVKDLFFNIPARRKFLKAESTELFHIIDTVTREALSHHAIGFVLITDGRETIVLPRASGYRERIMQVYGGEFLLGLTEVTAEEGDLRMHALVSGPDQFRNSRAHQLLFINSRPVKDQSVSHALYKAYEGLLPAEKHPVFFLFIDMDPNKVDFNVHPTKREVRFADKEHIYQFVNDRIREAVKGGRAEYASQFREPLTDSQYRSPAVEYGPCPPAPGVSSVSENIEFAYRPSIPFLYLGDTFIALSGRGGLTLIDHHAAHERVLYEQILKKMSTPAHALLFPYQVKLSHKEYLAILTHKELMWECGLELDDFGHDTVIVRAIPDPIESADLRGILSDVAAALLEGVRPERSLKESVAARIACHSSVRGREVLNQEECARLIEDLEKTEHPDQCPHGRPTRLFYSLDDLKKLFKRK